MIACALVSGVVQVDGGAVAIAHHQGVGAPETKHRSLDGVSREAEGIFASGAERHVGVGNDGTAVAIHHGEITRQNRCLG